LFISPFIDAAGGRRHDVARDPRSFARRANYILTSFGLPPSDWLASPSWVIPTVRADRYLAMEPYVAPDRAGRLAVAAPSVYEEPRSTARRASRPFSASRLPLLLPPSRQPRPSCLQRRSLALFRIIYITTQGGPGNAQHAQNIYGFRVGFSSSISVTPSALMLTLTAIVFAGCWRSTACAAPVAW